MAAVERQNSFNRNQSSQSRTTASVGGKSEFGQGGFLPSINSTANKSTKEMKSIIPKKSNFFSDDIDCFEWLSEIDMSQYTETFLTNLSSDGKIILRRRLLNIRQQDLSKMNITDFNHQKIIMNHIKLVLKHPFNDPVRKREALTPTLILNPPPARKSSLRGSIVPPLLNLSPNNNGPYTGESPDPNSMTPGPDSNEEGKNDDKPKESLKRVDKQKEKQKQAKRRRSFDSSVWNSISSMRNRSSENAAAAESLREGNFATAKTAPDPEKNRIRRRRSMGSVSFDEESVNNNSTTNRSLAKSLAYGNMAQEYDMMLTSLRTLQSDYLRSFQATINCEKSSIFFIHETTRELVLFTDNGSYYRIPPGSGIAGYCADHGVRLNISDAYADPRFNR